MDRCRQSKFLSLLLRHRPEDTGLTLDPAGWAMVDDLLVGMQRSGWPITRQDLFEVVKKTTSAVLASAPMDDRSAPARAIPYRFPSAWNGARPPKSCITTPPPIA